MRWIISLCFVMLTGLSVRDVQADQAADALVKDVVTAAGGEEKLLKIFRFRERVLISDKTPPSLTPDEKGNRTSVIELPDGWWLGTSKRSKEKAMVLVYAWSLRMLLDPKSQIEALPERIINDQPVFGLRVTGSTKEPLELYFTAADNRLLCIENVDTRHIFSEWKQTDDGRHYPSRVIGYRFKDRKAGVLNDKPWYQTDVLELTPLAERPPELK